MAASPALPRRERLLSSAATLFAAHGYHAVGVDEIGAAAGITGPGVYRHFAGKQAVLEALCDRAMTGLLAGARGIPQAHADPREALGALVELHARFAAEQRALLGVWTREQRELSEEVRRSLRRRQRAYEQPWRDVLARLRPDLDDAEVALAVRVTLGMLNATAVTDGRLPPERVAPLLRRMALAALLSRRAPARPRSQGATGS